MLYLTAEQEQKAARIAGCCRAIWNASLEQRELAWRMRGRRVLGIEQMAELPALKREPGFGDRPRFKTKGRNESFRLPQGRDLPLRKLNRRWAEVRVPKLGWCRFRLTRAVGGEIRHATLRQ